MKGRASSKPLNYELAKSIPHVIGSDLYAGYGFWFSKLNRADGPTRDSDPDPPDSPEPWWWQGVCNGDSAAFDAWLKDLEQRVAPTQVEEDLLLAVDLCTGRQARRRGARALYKEGQPARTELQGCLLQMMVEGDGARELSTKKGNLLALSCNGCLLQMMVELVKVYVPYKFKVPRFVMEFLLLSLKWSFFRRRLTSSNPLTSGSFSSPRDAWVFSFALALWTCTLEKLALQRPWLLEGAPGF